MNNMPMIISALEVLPKELKITADFLNNDCDYGFAVTSEPIMLLMVLESVTEMETETVVNNPFEMGFSIVNKVGYITLNYGNDFCFEFSIFNGLNTDVVNIILVERSNMIVKGIRVVSADEECIKKLDDNINDSKMSKTDLEKTVFKIRDKFSTEQIHNSGFIQKFR